MWVITESGVIFPNEGERCELITSPGGKVIKQLFNGKHHYSITDSNVVNCDTINLSFSDPKAREITKIFHMVNDNFFIQYPKSSKMLEFDETPEQVVLFSEIIGGINIFAVTRGTQIVVGFGEKQFAREVTDLDTYTFDPNSSTRMSSRMSLTFAKTMGPDIMIERVIFAKNDSGYDRDVPIFTAIMTKPRLFSCGSILVVYDSGKIYQIKKNLDLEQMEGDFIGCYTSYTNDCIVGVSQDDPKYTIIQSDATYTITERPLI